MANSGASTPGGRCSACGHCAGQRAGVLSKQAKLVKHILANPPRTRGGTQVTLDDKLVSLQAVILPYACGGGNGDDLLDIYSMKISLEKMYRSGSQIA